MFYETRYDPPIVRPSDWEEDTMFGFLTTGLVIGILSLVAAFFCMLVAIIHIGPPSDKNAIGSLREAWTLVSQDSAAHYQGQFPAFSEIKRVIENGNDDLGFTDFTATYGVGPAGVHDTDGSTILVDQKSTPRFLEMFIHSSGTGRDIELTALPGQDPKIFYPSGVKPPNPNARPKKHHDDWGPLEWLGIVDGMIAGAFVAILLLFSIVGNFLLWRHRNPDTISARRVFELVERYRNTRIARQRAQEDEALSQERWQALVGHGVYGPLKQSAGYELFVADKTESVDKVQFHLDCYRWSAHTKDWVKVTDQVEMPQLPIPVQMTWDVGLETGAMYDAWFDLCNAVDRLNRARWAAIDPEAATKAIGANSTVAALPPPSQMIDGAPAGIDALRAKGR